MNLRRSHLRNRDQGGYVLLAILFALTVLIVGLAVAAPRAATALRRTKEDELVRRGQQYALGIRRFYKKFGRYPSNLDQLENTNNIRFIRRRYLDPLTGKDDWTPIQFGQARPAVGFFGQKIVNTSGQSPSGPGLGPSAIGTGLGGSSGSGPSSVGNQSSTAGSTSSNSGAAGTGPSGTAAPGSPSGPAGSATNPFSSDQLSGRSFGGGAIVGVSVPSQKESLKEFQQKNHYNEWQFVYDPTMDPTLRGGASAGAATGIPGVAGNLPGQGVGGLGQGIGGLSPGTTNNPPTNTPPTNNPMSPAMPK
jgi:type II secretory pathway pseudopilin PulG